MRFLTASALRIHTIISVTSHEGPHFVELSESRVHLVRDKSRKGSFKNEKPRVLRGFFCAKNFSVQRFLCVNLMPCNPLSLNDAVIENNAVHRNVEQCWQHLNKTLLDLDAHKNSGEHHAGQ